MNYSLDSSKTREDLEREVEELRYQLEQLRTVEHTAEQRRLQAEKLQAFAEELTSMQHKLRSNQAFLEAIVDHLPAMIFVKEAETLRFVRINRAATELMGFAPEEMLGKCDYDFFPPEEADFFTQKDREVLVQGTLYEIQEEPIHTRHKGLRYLHTKKVPILDPDTGEPCFLLGISLDITEEKRIREQLQQSNEKLEKRVEERTQKLSEANAQLHQDIAERRHTEARLRATEELNQRFLESLPGGVFHIDANGTILQANPQALAFFQHAPQTLEALSLHVLEHRMIREDESPCRPEDTPFRQALETGKPQGPVTLGTLRPDGSIGWAVYTAVPVRDPDNNHVTSVVLTFLDITEKKREEEERKTFEAKLRHAQKLESLGVLAGGIAHDFNNLLVGILGNADLALDEVKRTNTAHKLLQQIQDTAAKASELTKQLLAYSGRGKFEIKLLHLSQLAEEVSELLQAAIPRNVVLKTDLEEELPLVEGDPAQLQQVFMNLLINAAESYEGDSGVVSLRTGKTELYHRGVTDTFTGNEIDTGQYVYIEVMDRGRGMDEQTQAKIFEPFYTTKFTGRGLGLAAVLGIVRGHHGMIKIASELQRGTIFTVFFPISQKLPTHTPLSADPLLNTSLAAWCGETILVVDDDKVVRSVARNMLQRMGLHPLLAADGLEGLAMFREHASHITAVLLDLTMPNMGGREAFQRMKAIDPTVPIVLCSGYSEEEATAAFVGKGIAGFLEKPFTRKKLQQKLSEVLSPLRHPTPVPSR